MPGTSIQAEEDHWLKPDGKPPLFIPKGTNLGVDIYGLHTHPDLWKDPKTWDCYRWVQGSPSFQKLKHPVAFNGFSVGSRSCIGSQFALMEVRDSTRTPRSPQRSSFRRVGVCTDPRRSACLLSSLQTRAITALLVRELDMEIVEGERYEVITQKLTLEPAYGLQVRVRKNPLRPGKANGGTAKDEAKES